MALTDMQIWAAKPAAKIRKLSDGKALQLCVLPNGSKLWRLAYRHEGKQRTLSIGSWPTVTLVKARLERDKARTLLSSGVDPMAQKRANAAAKMTADAQTFSVIADELLAKKQREGKAPSTLEKTRWLLDLARPVLGARPIRSIMSAEVLAVLRSVEARGRLNSAKRLRALIGEIFRYGISTARCEHDPSGALKGALAAAPTRHQAAIIDPAQFGGLLRAIDDFRGQPTTKAALQLLALTFARPGELRGAEWAEFDLDGAIWCVPLQRTKMRRPHSVPMSHQAVGILRAMRSLSGGGRFVFPGVRPASAPISDTTLNSALRRMGFTKDEMTAHGFRASASSMLNESGRWSRDAIERQLAHVDGDSVRRAYARGDFWAERVVMMQYWADYLDLLRTGGAKVISLPLKALIGLRRDLKFRGRSAASALIHVICVQGGASPTMK